MGAVRGFTLVEVLITLTLSSIGLGVTYKLCDMTHRMAWHFERQNEFVVSYEMFCSKMHTEMARNSRIFLEDRELLLVATDTSSFYIKIRRDSIVFDYGDNRESFKLRTVKFQPDLILTGSRKALIRCFLFDFSYNKQTYRFICQKNYSGEEVLEEFK